MGILVSLLITVITYLIVPIIMLASNGGRFPKKKAHRIALWNSIIVGTLFFIITIAANETAGWTPLPAFFYYWINRVILIEKTPSQPNNTLTLPEQEDQTTNTPPPQSAVSPSTPIEKVSRPTISYCRKCGNKLIEGSAFCNKCGSKTSWN